MLSKENDDEHLMHSETNQKISIGSETNEIINKLFELFFTTYQLVLQKSMKCSNFVSVLTECIGNIIK